MTTQETKQMLKRVNELLGTDYDRLNWAYISAFNELTDDFIREFANYLDWDFVLVFQNLSENIIAEYGKSLTDALARLTDEKDLFSVVSAKYPTLAVHQS